jgi:hypothetical protein
MLAWMWGRKGTFKHNWWECKLVQQLWKLVWRFLKKLEIELPYGPAIPILHIYPKKSTSAYNRDTQGLGGGGACP